MGKYFGTDGFRGEANVKLTVEHAFKVGRYLGWYYGRDHKARIVIGKDTRRSSYMFEYALAAGITASGADAYLLHVTTTPSVSYVVRTEGFDCGIMISASHNPFYDNGIKVINGLGHKLEAEVELKESQGALHKLRTAIAEGKYLEASQAGQELAEFLEVFRRFVNAIPTRMAGQLHGTVDAVTVRAMEQNLRQELDGMLHSFVTAATSIPGEGAAQS